LRELRGSDARPVSGPPLFRAIDPRRLRKSEMTYLQVLRMRVVCRSTGSIRLGAAAEPLFGATDALCEQFHGEDRWMLAGTSDRARTANRFAPQPWSGREPSRRLGSIPGRGRQMAPQPLGWYPLVPKVVLTETACHDPETGDLGRLLGVYSTFGLCFRLRSRMGAHFPPRPDISIAGNYQTFLLRFDTPRCVRVLGPIVACYTNGLMIAGRSAPSAGFLP
jgi:hypothetical protein